MIKLVSKYSRQLSTKHRTHEEYEKINSISNTSRLIKKKVMFITIYDSYLTLVKLRK